MTETLVTENGEWFSWHIRVASTSLQWNSHALTRSSCCRRWRRESLSHTQSLGRAKRHHDWHLACDVYDCDTTIHVYIIIIIWITTKLLHYTVVCPQEPLWLIRRIDCSKLHLLRNYRKLCKLIFWWFTVDAEALNQLKYVSWCSNDVWWKHYSF